MISVFYDLPLDDRPGYVRKALNNKMPNGKLTLNLRAFHAIDQSGKPDPTGSPFNIASEIRHQLIHDEIEEIVFFPSLSLLQVFRLRSPICISTTHFFRMALFPSIQILK